MPDTELCLNCEQWFTPAKGREWHTHFCTEQCEEEFHIARAENSEVEDESGRLWGMV